MRLNEIKQEINKLNLSEKLLLIEDVWDSIAQDNSELTMPEWQKRELEKRYQAYKAGEQNLHDWQSVEQNEIVVHSVFDNRQDPQKRPFDVT